MKNKAAVLGFIAVAIVCVTALIIWQDLKKDIAALGPKDKVELTDNEKAQYEAIEEIREELKRAEANCFINWETGDAYVRANLFRNDRVNCSFDLKNRVRKEIVTYSKKIKHQLAEVLP